MNVAIIDSSVYDRIKLISIINKIAQNKNFDVNISEFCGGDEFLFAYKHQFDVVFMDTEMSKKNGIEVAAKLREIDKHVPLVFVTHSASYAMDGYEVSALDYLVKPVDEVYFLSKINRILNRALHRQQKIMVKVGQDIVVIDKNRVTYLESSGHYTTYHTLDGKFTSYSTFKKAISAFDNNKFEFCNRCYYVNLDYVKKIENEFVHVMDEKVLISRPRKKGFIKALTNYIVQGSKF